jgi:uncharacterized membrane protein YcaP (DUF421 family)
MVHSLVYIPLPLLEKLVRVAASLVFLMLLLRFLGNRVRRQLTTFDFVCVTFMTSSIQGSLSGGDDSLLGAFFSASVVVLIMTLATHANWTSPRFNRIVEGPPVTFIRKGVLDKQGLRKEMISRDMLRRLIREEGIENLADVDWAGFRDGSFEVTAKTKQTLEERLAVLEEKIDTLLTRIPK